MYRLSRRIFPPQSKSSAELDFTLFKKSTKLGLSRGQPPGTRVDRRRVVSSSRGPAGSAVRGSTLDDAGDWDAGASRERKDRPSLAGRGAGLGGSTGDGVSAMPVVFILSTLVLEFVPVNRRVNLARPAHDSFTGSILWHARSERLAFCGYSTSWKLNCVGITARCCAAEAAT